MISGNMFPCLSQFGSRRRWKICPIFVELFILLVVKLFWGDSTSNVDQWTTEDDEYSFFSNVAAVSHLKTLLMSAFTS